MADYSHRRATSEVVTSQHPAGGVVYGHKQTAMDRRLPETNDMVRNNETYANTNFHFRSQSYESPYSSDSYVGREPVSAPATRRSRYGNLLSAESAQSTMQRRGSESSTSSVISNCTATAENAFAWSAATTPETMSPVSPSNSLLPNSPPERTSSKVALSTMAPPALTSKTSHQPLIPCRLSRARACSHSAPKGLPNSLFESTVFEEEEQTDMRRNSKTHQKTASLEANTVGELTMPAAGILREAKSVSNLRQRRQQRQQKIAGKPQAKQPVRLRLSPLPPLPLDQQVARRLSTVSPRTLKSSRSLPQLRDAAGPPPTGPLPPLPNSAATSLSPLPTPRTPAIPPTPSFSSSSDACPPYPVGPPPPPPSRPPPESPGLAANPTKRSPVSERHSNKTEPHSADQSSSWEEELRRHKKLLEQFPCKPEERQDLPKLSRSYRSLGNIRARSRSLSRATGSSSHDDAAIAEPSHHTSSFSLRGSKTQRPSTTKSLRDTDGQAREAAHSMVPANAPHISVFEDDSDEEGDVVRKFVRNLFTRRTRSGEVPVGNQHTSDQIREVSSGSKYSIASTKGAEGNGHNDRKKNHSASSTFSIATTVGANTIVSTASTLVPASTCDCKEGCEIVSNIDSDNPPSPRTSSDHSRQHQKGPLLSRMFVRRSH
ncbi:hypothetical protein SEUCBS139899_005208 [Sporothrix eucalyptigena]